MHTIESDTLRQKLEDRQERLRGALDAHPGDEAIEDLLTRVDGALDRLDDGTHGRCLVCTERVAGGDLAKNPLLEYCLCHLTPKQQRALEHDLGLARRIQSGLLPDPDVRTPSWHAHYRYEPAGVVSGDYCDLLRLPGENDTIFFVVADVSGKGVAASLLMAHIQAAFRSLVDARVPLAELVARVNQQLLDVNLPTHYATLAGGRASSDGRVELVNAGHCTPVVLRACGVEMLGPTGVPVGILDDRPYAVTELHLEPGDALVLHTDGLTEARSPSGEEYASARLAETLLRACTRHARGIVEAVREDLSRFVAGSPLGDDLTLMALVRNGGD